MLSATPEDRTETAPHCILTVDQGTSSEFFRAELAISLRGPYGPAGSGAYLLRPNGDYIW